MKSKYQNFYTIKIIYTNVYAVKVILNRITNKT